MAVNNTKTTAAKAATSKVKPEKDVAAVEETLTTEVTTQAEPKSVKAVVPKDIDINQYITVRNGFQGKLVYKSNRTGELFIWDAFGDEQEIELRELKDAKNSRKKMFINNWFMFDDEWVVDYLGLRQYYKHIVNIDEFDELFNMEAGELSKAISEMSEGQKRSVSYRARELVKDGEIDSLKKIETLEKALGVEIIEK